MSSQQASSFGGQLTRKHVLNPITALAFYISTSRTSSVSSGGNDGRQSNDANKRLYLLIGEDTNIKILDATSSRLCGIVPVFAAQSIHGIAVPPLQEGPGSRRPRQILVWGGQSLKVIPEHVIERTLATGHSKEEDCEGVVEGKAPDWIFDGKVSPFKEDEGRVVLLTAHNEVMEARVETADVSEDREKAGIEPPQSCLVFDNFQSPSRPILYSGNLYWTSRSCILVAAGTVFGEILVWKYHLNLSKPGQSGGDGDIHTSKSAGCQVLFVFSGHEGSIFGVQISHEIQTADGETLRLLASCSDDRTIRVWDITERPCDGADGFHLNSVRDREDGSRDRLSDARETGFGDNAQTGTLPGDDYSNRCLATIIGHVSRIWQVEFPQSQKLLEEHNIIELYSFGEDATAQQWHLKMHSKATQNRASNYVHRSICSLTHQSTYSNHSGKHISSHIMTSGDVGNVLVSTGGSDGKVALMDDSHTESSKQPQDGHSAAYEHPTRANQSVKLTVTDVVSSFQPETRDSNYKGQFPTIKAKNDGEVFHRYTFVTEDTLLGITNAGRLFTCIFHSGLKWREISLPNKERTLNFSYSGLASSASKAIAFIGTSCGEIWCYNHADGGSLQKLAQGSGKVSDIIYLSRTSNELDPNNHVSETTRETGIELLVTSFEKNLAEILRFDHALSVVGRATLSLHPSFLVTAAAYCRGYLVLGSRNGFLAILNRTKDGMFSTLLSMEVKRREMITSILPLSGNRDQSPNYFLATCRDGKYRIFEIKRLGDVTELQLLHETNPPFRLLIEGAWFVPAEDGAKDLLLCGFRSRHFVVWNQTTQQEIGSVDCGGSHRSFAYTAIARNPEGFRFVFTKTSHMHIASQTRTLHRTIKPGGHGREIRAVSASGNYVATAAEDTTIRIWEYEPHTSLLNRGFRNVELLAKHTAGIQTLKLYGSRYLFSSAGNEEFFVWKINVLDNDYIRFAVVCEAVFPDKSEVGDLRIMDFDVERIDKDGKAEDEPEFCISMALSDSTLQSYSYTKANGFCLLGRRVYTGVCLTQLRHLGFPSGKPHVLTASTDGHLALFKDLGSPSTARDSDKGPEESATVLVTKLHQNSVKALDMRRISCDAGSSYLIVTCGDDNALGIVHVFCQTSSSATLPSSLQYSIENKCVVRSAHAAAITGIAIARLENDGRDAIVVTASNDQRVKTWRVIGWQSPSSSSTCATNTKLHLLDDQYSGVADAGDLEILDGGTTALVVGVGMEVWDISGWSVST